MQKRLATSRKGWNCFRCYRMPERSQQELTLQITLGASLIATKGYGAPEVGQTYTRARQLCQHLEDPYQLFQYCADFGIIITRAPRCRRHTPCASSS